MYMLCLFLVAGWAIAGLDYFNSVLKNLTREQDVGGVGNETSVFSRFEKECMEDWKLEYELKNDQKRGKKRGLAELNRSTNFELEELSKAFLSHEEV